MRDVPIESNECLPVPKRLLTATPMYYTRIQEQKELGRERLRKLDINLDSDLY